MGPRPAAVLNGEWGHDLLAMPRAVFHQGPADVSSGKAPSLAKIGHAIADIDIGPCKLRKITFEAKHRRGFGPHLHQADFAHRADGVRIIAALDCCDGVGDIGRQAVLLGLRL